MNAIVGQPNWNRVLRAFLEIEAAHYGAALVSVRDKEGQDGLNADAGNHRSNHGERGVYEAGRMAG